MGGASVGVRLRHANFRVRWWGAARGAPRRRAARFATAATETGSPPWSAAQLELLRTLFRRGASPRLQLAGEIVRESGPGSDFLVTLICEDPATGDRVDVALLARYLVRRRGESAEEDAPTPRESSSRRS